MASQLNTLSVKKKAELAKAIAEQVHESRILRFIESVQEVEMGDISKGKVLEWLSNAIEAITAGKARQPNNKRYINECDGKLHSYMLIQEKIINGQFLLNKDENMKSPENEGS